jgi:hypothetical protein
MNENLFRFLGWLMTVGGGAFVTNWITPVLIESKLIGGPEEFRLAGIAPGLVAFGAVTALGLNVGKLLDRIQKSIVKMLWIVAITFLALVICKAYVGNIPVNPNSPPLDVRTEAIWTQFLWTLRFIAFSLNAFGIGWILGAAWQATPQTTKIP